MSEIFKRYQDLPYELFILPYGDAGVADVLVRTERLMFKQFEYEETSVISGKQLCYSEYFKVYIKYLLFCIFKSLISILIMHIYIFMQYFFFHQRL